MYNSFIILCLQTIILWSLVFFLHRKKERFTLMPLYSLLAVLTVFIHNLSDLGFAVVFNNLYFLISSFSFFTSLMLGVLILYLFEGPRAARIALYIILLTSALYIGVVFLLGLQVDTSKWIHLDFNHFVTYFWSITAIIFDVFFITIFWELLGKIKKMPLSLQIFLVISSTLFLDAIIFVTGVFGKQPIFWSVLQGGLAVRLFLSIIATPLIILYLKTKEYNEGEREKPKKFWEILNFRSDLEIKVKTMEETINQEKELREELEKSEEKYQLALKGANAGIWDWDMEKNRIMYSAKFCSMLGFKDGELSETIEDFKKMLHEKDVDKTFSVIDKSLKNKTIYSVEYRLKMKDGSYRWFLSGGVTKYNSSDKAIRMVGSIIDINDKKMIDESYKEKVEELEYLNKAMVDRELKMIELKKELEDANIKSK